MPLSCTFRFDLEPVGSKAPAFTGTLKGGWMEAEGDSHVVLLCPAQGFPVPTYRYILENINREKAKQFFKPVLFFFFFFFFTFTVLAPLEPVGSKAPAFTGALKGVWMEAKGGTHAVLFCPAQGYPVPSFR